LIACYETGQEIRVKKLHEGADVWEWVSIYNVAHRHMTVGQIAMFGQARQEAERRDAKERQRRKPVNSVPVTLPEQKGDSRDRIAASAGVSGSSIDKAAKVRQHRPDLAEQVRQGKLDLEPAYREARKAEGQKKSQAVELPMAPPKK